MDWLQSDKLTRRIVSGLTLGLACMYLTWAIGYFLLPEGVLRGKTGAGFVSDLLPEPAGLMTASTLFPSIMRILRHTVMALRHARGRPAG